MTRRWTRLALAGLLVQVAACEKPKQGQKRQPAPTQGAPQPAKPPRPLDLEGIATALGRSGALQPGDAYKIGFPRSDLRVTVQGVSLKPALALGAWVAFKAVGDSAVVLGDLVLREDEVGRVLAKLEQGGIEQTALHNHLLRETPRVVYVHIHAVGDPVKIARAVRAAIALTRTPPARPAAQAAPLGLDTAGIHKILGYEGRASGGVYQVGVPRAEPIRADGTDIPPAMGVAAALNFQPTGRGKAAITGDFVLTANEVNPVMVALRQHGIAVTALHSHMLTEEPRLFFLHFWANARATDLARGLRAALDKMNVRGGTQAR